MFLIIGARSYLGSYIVKNIKENTNEKILATFHSSESSLPEINNVIWQHLDVTDEKSIIELREVITRIKSETEEVKCVYVVGYIKPDDCFTNPELAIDINIRSLANFIFITKDIIDGLIFTSTDFVCGQSFNAYRYTEKDLPHPINLYGTIKHSCESIVRLAGYNSVRLPFMFGKSLIPGRPHFIEHVERTIEQHEVFEVLSDYYENSLNYNTVAYYIYKLFEKFGPNIPEPLIHICGDKAVSKYDIAISFAKKNGLDLSYLKPIKLSNASFFKAKRCTILLDNSLIKSLLDLDVIKVEL